MRLKLMAMVSLAAALTLASCADTPSGPVLTSNGTSSRAVKLSTGEILFAPNATVKTFTIEPKADDGVEWRLRTTGRGVQVTPSSGRGAGVVTVRLSEAVPGDERTYVGDIQVDVAASDVGRGSMAKTAADKKWHTVSGARISLWHSAR